MFGHLANPTPDTRRRGFKNNGAEEAVSRLGLEGRLRSLSTEWFFSSREDDVEQGHWSE